jgi:hypothetical protein
MNDSMNAIVTRYIGPSNRRGSRITARSAAGHLTVEYDDAFNSEENHRLAARALKVKLRWTERVHGELRGGVMPNGDYSWVMVANEIDAPRTLLKRALACLNRAPRFKVPALECDSYEVAADIDDYFHDEATRN